MMPLHRYPVLDARSVREAREDETLFRRVDDYETLCEPERFRVLVNSVVLDGVRLSAVRTNGHRVRPVDANNAAVLLAQRGVLETHDGRVGQRIRAGEAALPRPGRRTTTIPGGYLGLVMQVPMPLLAARAALNGEDPWRPEYLWPARPPARLVRTMRYVVHELDAEDGAPPGASIVGGMSRLLTDVLLDGIAGAAAEVARPVSSAGLRQVRLAEQALRARLHEPVSLVELAGEIGISTRALQAGFRRHRGVTPRNFLATCRLEAARERLLQARPGETVASIAHDCGVMHLGRFAASYRAQYGEAPSETLARARLNG